MLEILNNALPKNYHKELTSKEWNIYEQPFQKIVDKLEVAQPAIKQAAAIAKSIADLNTTTMTAVALRNATLVAMRKPQVI